MKPSELIALVCDELEISPENLTGKRRFRCVSEARWITAAVLREHLGMTIAEIGARLRVDHTAVSYGLRKIREAGECNKALARKMERVERSLRDEH